MPELTHIKPTGADASLLSNVWKWADFVKISHTVFALPFAIASMAVAARDQHGWPGWRIFLLILAAGDCRSRTTKRVAFAVGDGALAVTCVHDFLGTYA
jgi:hypothetical protein